MTENKVSIVVPVYNAQKWLGYCLNSLLAQTWTEFEVILVNDGSTDDSLEICRNYAELDSRFRVLDVPNGGVSRARNLGVSQATGRYLVFVDSDDVVTPDMLEVMLDCARRTGMELVAGDMSLVDFARPEAPRGLLCARWAGEGERVYDKEAFARNRMRLIFNTSLLEGPCAKLYSLDLWRKLDLQFPPELSLGEDFVTNMQYYAACNGIAFLNRTVYYYNNESQSNSLTHQYRKDLFETKMYLIERLREFIGPQEEMDPDEWSCYCSYVACTGFKCLAAVVSKRCARLWMIRCSGKAVPGTPGFPMILWRPARRCWTAMPKRPCTFCRPPPPSLCRKSGSWKKRCRQRRRASKPDASMCCKRCCIPCSV